jgi:hypothetical protein
MFVPAIQLANHSAQSTDWWPMAALFGGLVLVLLATLVFERRRRFRRHEPPVTDEWRARVLMEELCPHGWQAQITLFGRGAPAPPDAPAGREELVALDWTEFREAEDGDERVAVVRRVWAPTIAGALQAMIADRRTDLALEEIERAAVEDDPEGR